MEKNIDRLAQWVNEVNQAGGTYHQLNLGDGLVIQGDYDMKKYSEDHFTLSTEPHRVKYEVPHVVIAGSI